MRIKLLSLVRHLVTLTCIIVITGCGGGGGSSGSPVPPSSGPSTPSPPPVFQAGIFENSSNFKSLCEFPRTGINPATRAPYLDIQGSATSENKWLRSWSNELYLWYDEITDRNPALFSDPLVYFDTLKTPAITPSGRLRDNFHFTYPSDVWNQLSQSGVSSGYGLSLAILNSQPPREIVVQYVEPNSPAENAGLARGSKILTIDGVDANTQAAIDTINQGLFPVNNGESHSFDISHPGTSTISNVSMLSTNVTSSPVLKVETVQSGANKTGYILFNSHIATAEEQLVAAFGQLKDEGVTDLVLDLRYNGGGFLDIASQVAYMIAGPSSTNGRTFELQKFNDKHPVTDPVTDALIEPLPFHNQTLNFSLPSGQSLPTLELSRVVIITGKFTCSASEAIINSLRGINVEVILVGSTTCGKPYGFYPQDNCGTTYFTIQFSSANDIGFSDYSDGFSPQNTTGFVGVPVAGCSVADDFSNTLGSISEARFAAALQYLNNSSCPSPPTELPLNNEAPIFSSLPGEASFSTEIAPLQQSFFSQNRFMGRP